MTTSEAKTLLGLRSREAITTAIHRGKLEATKVGDNWDITPEAVEAYRINSLGKFPGHKKNQARKHKGKK